MPDRPNRESPDFRLLNLAKVVHAETGKVPFRRADAEAAKKKLEAAGAKVELK